MTHGYNRVNREVIAARRKKVMELRLQNYTFREIAKIVGTSSTTTFSDAKAVLKELVEDSKDMAEEIRATELLYLNELQVAAMPDALEGDTKSINTILSIQKRRAELLGLDAVVKKDITMGFDVVLPKGG
jgi:hypothetical protein